MSRYIISVFIAGAIAAATLLSGRCFASACKASMVRSCTLSDSINPLVRFSPIWADPKYASCNTAAATSFLTEKEKQVIYILNLARVNPSLFLRTVIKQYPAYADESDLPQSSYYKSLLVFLEKQAPMPILFPDKELYESAHCHALQSGKTGYVGHDRTTNACKRIEKFEGECCFYGTDDPLSIVVDLMIDEGVPSLGHRKILFTRFNRIGVSIASHSRYGWNTVLDLSNQPIND